MPRAVDVLLQQVKDDKYQCLITHICSGNGLMTDGTKPLPEPTLVINHFKQASIMAMFIYWNARDIEIWESASDLAVTGGHCFLLLLSDLTLYCNRYKLCCRGQVPSNMVIVLRIYIDSMMAQRGEKHHEILVVPPFCSQAWYQHLPLLTEEECKICLPFKPG